MPLLLAGCEGLFDGIYDDPPADDTFVEGFAPGVVPHEIVLRLNATSYEEWIYIDLHNLTITRRDIPMTPEEAGKGGITYQLVEGDRYTRLSETPVAAQDDPADWDLAIHHFDVRTNGGEVAVAPDNDIANASAAEASTLNYAPDEYSDNQVIVDLKEMMGFKIGFQNIAVNRVMSSWASMDFSTPPPVYSASGDVYYLRLGDGSVAAIKMRSYMSPKGSKGYLTIDIRYPL